MKKFVFAPIFFLLVFIFPYFSTVKAQICKKGECHYLRPYPTEPINVTSGELANFCGSDLTITQTATVKYNPDDPNCTFNGTNKITCSYQKPIDDRVVINLENANLPIMGNTEEVKNTENDEDIITDAEKVNEYVSWYLSGVPFKKEYGFPNPTESDLDTEEQKNLLNYSGPIAKLLPQEIQLAKRIETIERVSGKNLNDDNITPPKDRNNQTVVCTKTELDTLLLPATLEWALEKLGIGREHSVPCPEGEKIKLSEWEKDLSVINNLISAELSVMKLFAKIIPSVPGDIIQKVISENKPWNSRLPPLSWGKDSDGNPFDDLTYKKAYNEWRGKLCIIIPLPRMLVCVENILIPNKWADLFSYVPLSSTEDSKGQVNITSASFSTEKPSDLFFSHMEKSDELASLLRETYLYEGAGGDMLGEVSYSGIETPKSCSTVEVRSNKGDNLFATEIVGKLSYNASFTCDYVVSENAHDPLSCNICSAKKCVFNSLATSNCNVEYNECESDLECADFVGGVVNNTCTKTFQIPLSTRSYTPKVENIWSKLVAGPTSIFKRIYPKVGTQIGIIKDMAGSTLVDISVGGTKTTGELKFPHLGGISEYFLKGIQTALRPKGYGETISFGDVEGGGEDGDICAIADKYKIPCCMLKGIIEVETGNNPIFIGSGICNRSNKAFACCNGNYCGPANIGCNQYDAWDGGDGLDLCDYTDSAELLARALLFKLCQADQKCLSGWATDGDYILENYSIEDGSYTAAGYFYGVTNGCFPTACSQFRWGAGKTYCDAVEYYCDNGGILTSGPDVTFCEECNFKEMNDAGMPITCSLYE